MNKNSNDGYIYYQEITKDGLVNITNKPKEKDKLLYTYNGDVYRYDKCVIHNFHACTLAVSEKKAIQNILYKAKKILNLTPAAGGFMLKNNIDHTNI